MNDNLSFLKKTAKPKVFNIFTKLAGEKLEHLADKAVNLMKETEKSAERAMADVVYTPLKKGSK